MKVLIVMRLAVILLLLGICTRRGMAQVRCFSALGCSSAARIMGPYNTFQDCCSDPDSRAYETGAGEPCRECLIYGWTNEFPIEVVKGEELTLTVGFLKGSPPNRKLFNVLYNSDEVSVSPSRIPQDGSDVRVQVTVSEDVEGGDNIVITLQGIVNIAPDDILITEAILNVVAEEDPLVMVGFNATAITVREEEGIASVCLEAISTESVAVNVNITAIDGSAIGSVDYSTPMAGTLTANTTECLEVRLSTGDGYENSENFSLFLTSSAANVVFTIDAIEVTIVDSDEAYIQVDPAMVTVEERSGETSTVCLSVNGSTVDITARISDIPDTGDLDDLPTEVSLPADGSSICLEITAVDDDKIEGTEEIMVTWTAEEPRVVPASLTIIIEDFVPSPSPSPSPSIPPSPTPAVPAPSSTSLVIPSFMISSTFSPSPSPSPALSPPLPTATSPPTRQLQLPDFIADTISGGAFIATLINAHSTDTNSPMDMGLCYEIHGLQGSYFNFISQPCLSLNAHYMLQNPDKPLHFIDEIALVATDNTGNDVRMRIDRDCNLFIDGASTGTEFYNGSGIAAEAIGSFNDVVIDIDDDGSCGREGKMKMVVSCQAGPHGLIQLDISRDVRATNISSHGLLGQFWGYPIQATHYGEAPNDYLIEVSPSGDKNRRIVGSSHRFTWEYQRLLCLYVGDRQGGKGAGLHGGPNEPLIEGAYTDYLTTGPFDTNFYYSLF